MTKLTQTEIYIEDALLTDDRIEKIEDFEIKKGRNFLNVKFKAITVLGEVEIETEAVKIV